MYHWSSLDRDGNHNGGVIGVENKISNTEDYFKVIEEITAMLWKRNPNNVVITNLSLLN
jgi:hypothetical protein